jgi:aminoglycoside/choline kinase family phosphotransferase/choline kinase
MKAMILAAGFGTRLQPYTNDIPKPLFSIAGQPLLDIAIKNLIHAGCEAIIINTHHLHEQIEIFVAAHNYTIPVHTCYEPQILGTGGAIKNVADFWDDRPFMVVNGDVLSAIDLKKVYQFHCHHDHAVTLVLYDDPEINSVSVNQYGFVIDFDDQFKTPSCPAKAKRTFTGIQVLESEILDYIPANVYSNSIDAFKKMIANGKKLRGFIAQKAFWNDIGTPERYKKTAIEKTAPKAFRHAYPDYQTKPIMQTKLKGDGSERKWYRLSSDQRTLIMVDHGITTGIGTAEIDAFVYIGKHLEAMGIPVPQIYYHDRMAGLVFLEDLGDRDLQTAVRRMQSTQAVISWYKSVIHSLVKLSVSGAKGFDPAWAYQTPRYDSKLILERECRYFVEAFLNGYLCWNVLFEDYQQEFISLAHRALEFSTTGFMHRDMQSRNIMLKENKFYFIDFQAGRLGPIQYDLASLLIDPYVELPKNIQSQLFNYCVDELSLHRTVDPDRFRHCFEFCCLTRNLQILGAFGYLSGVMGKRYFEQYIPAAVKTLNHNLASLAKGEFPVLKALAEKISTDKKIAPLKGETIVEV